MRVGSWLQRRWRPPVPDLGLVCHNWREIFGEEQEDLMKRMKEEGGGTSEEDGDETVEVKPRWLLCLLQLSVFFPFHILHVPPDLSLSRSFNLVFPFSSPPLHFPPLAQLQFGFPVAMAAAC